MTNKTIIALAFVAAAILTTSTAYADFIDPYVQNGSLKTQVLDAVNDLVFGHNDQETRINALENQGSTGTELYTITVHEDDPRPDCNAGDQIISAYVMDSGWNNVTSSFGWDNSPWIESGIHPTNLGNGPFDYGAIVCMVIP